MQVPVQSEALEGVWARHDPAAPPAPVVLDSPHSGRLYPPDFGAAAPWGALRATEDMFVDELFGAAPGLGVTLLRALFPRSYIDANRHPRDLDVAMLDGPWPGDAEPGRLSGTGRGLIRRKAGGGVPVYDRKLSAAEVARRLEGYYRPYHGELERLVAAHRRRFGQVWHLNCHSWAPPLTNSRGEAIRHIDVCLGDRDGTTCSADFTALVAETLREMGYVVRVNRPFKGVELVRRHGRPHAGQHSLQVEVNRRIYMDNARYVRTERFEALRADLTRLVARVCDHARAQVGLGPPAPQAGEPAAAARS